MQAGILNAIFNTLFLTPPEASIEDAVYRGHGIFQNRSTPCDFGVKGTRSP